VNIRSQALENVICKNCGSHKVVRFGTYKGIQRYWCKDCQRKFKADDTLFHMKTPANQVSSALNMYYEGMSIKAIRRLLQQEYNNAPSTATIYEWVMKYTQYATDSIKGYQPKVGDTWICDETVLEIDGQNVWFWDVIDEKTRYLLASRLSQSRTTRDAQTLMNRAIKTAGKTPKTFITDKLKSYLDVRYGKDTEHLLGSPFSVEVNTSVIERFHGTLKDRTKVMRGLKNIETAHDFTQGWLVHYNYLRPHEALDDKTPAKVAKINYPYKN
jgi:transposase-like protein